MPELSERIFRANNFAVEWLNDRVVRQSIYSVFISFSIPAALFDISRRFILLPASIQSNKEPRLFEQHLIRIRHPFVPWRSNPHDDLTYELIRRGSERFALPRCAHYSSSSS